MGVDGLSGPPEFTRLPGAAGQAHLQRWAERGEGTGPRWPLPDPLPPVLLTGIRCQVLGLGGERETLLSQPSQPLNAILQLKEAS